MSATPLLLILLALAAAAHAEVPANGGFPEPYSARYKGAMGLLDSRVDLARTEQGLRYEYRSRLAGRSLYECSILALQDGQLAPLEFVHKEIGGDGRRDEHIVFDAAARSVTVSRGGESRAHAKLDFPVWDVLSVQLKVAADAGRGLTTLAYQVADKGGIKARSFRIGEPGKVAFDGKEYDGIRIERDEPEKKFYFLAAPALGHVPVELGFKTEVFGWVRATIVEYQAASASRVPARCEAK